MTKADTTADQQSPEALSGRIDTDMLASPERFFNRELSWLEFNKRVLEFLAA